MTKSVDEEVDEDFLEMIATHGGEVIDYMTAYNLSQDVNRKLMYKIKVGQTLKRSPTLLNHSRAYVFYASHGDTVKANQTYREMRQKHPLSSLIVALPLKATGWFRSK